MNNNRPQQNMQMGSGSSLTRYRSAPSSYFETLLSSPTSDGGDDLDHLFNPRAAPSAESPGVFSRFTDCTEAVRRNSSTASTPGKAEVEQLPIPNISDYSSSPYGVFPGSFNSGQVKMERVGGAPSLIRHSSSPAGLFANPDFDNEIRTMRAMGNYGGGNAETSCSSGSRFKIQMNPIPEVDIKATRANNDDDYITGLPMSGWDDSDVLSENFFKGLDEQSNEGGSRPPARLSHHLSLPSSSSELSAMDKLLQDSVPCKIRAKRGFATHPRSIAERVRRTKISERIRKLQELVPNMDKQTNTSDMLDFAVDYIKVLQRQVETLSDNRAKCSCSAKHNTEM